MYKTATLNLRINPKLKKQADDVLSKLGIPMSTAIDIYLNQIVLGGGIPFNVTLPKPPADIDASQMSKKQLEAKLEARYNQCKKGKAKDAKKALLDLRKKLVNEKI